MSAVQNRMLESILVWGSCGINWMIICPWAAAELYHYIRLRTQPFFFERMPSHVIALCFFCLFVFSIYSPGSTLIFFYRHQFPQLNVIRQVFWYIISAGGFVAVYRLWVLIFAYKADLETVNNIIEGYNSKFLTYKDSWGDGHRVAWICVLSYLLFSAIATYFQVATLWVAFWLMNIVVVALFEAVVMILWMNLTDLEDALFIKGECLITVCAISGTMIGSGIELLWWLIYNGQPPILLKTAQMLFISMGYLLMFYGMTRYVRMKYETFYLLTLENASSNAEEEMPFGLREVLSLREGYTNFLKYLVKEYSTENLLYPSEIFAFYETFFSESGPAPPYNASILFKYSPDMPRSRIMNEMQNWRLRFEMIYRKFLAPESPSQINISSRLQSDISGIYFKIFPQRSDSSRSYARSFISKIRSQVAFEPQFSRSLRSHLTEMQPIRPRNSTGSSTAGTNDSDTLETFTSRPATQSSLKNPTDDPTIDQVYTVGIQPIDIPIRRFRSVSEEDRVLLRETFELLIKAAGECQSLLHAPFARFCSTQGYEMLYKKLFLVRGLTSTYSIPILVSV